MYSEFCARAGARAMYVCIYIYTVLELIPSEFGKINYTEIG